MKRFCRKSIFVEAEQFDPNKKPWPDDVTRIGRSEFDPTSWTGFRIQTLEGWMVITPGDWIITRVNGERYPCKPDIFEKTYEEVQEIKESTNGTKTDV